MSNKANNPFTVPKELERVIGHANDRNLPQISQTKAVKW